MARYDVWHDLFRVCVNDSGELGLEFVEPYDDPATFSASFREKTSKTIASAMLFGLIPELGKLMNQWDKLTDQIAEAESRSDREDRSDCIEERDVIAHEIADTLSTFRRDVFERV